MAGQPSGAVGRLEVIVLDVNDLTRSTDFWSKVLGGTVEPGVGPQYMRIKQPSAPTLILQVVPERKVVKNRAHVDITVEDIDRAITLVEALGGRWLRTVEEPRDRFAVMADPEGNEFCLVTAAGGGE